MRTLKKIIALMLALAFIPMATACSLFPDGTINEVENGTMNIETNGSGQIQGQLTPSVDIDAKVSIPEGAQWKQYSAVVRKESREQTDKNVSLFTFGNTIEKVVEQELRVCYEFSDGSRYLDGDYIAYWGNDMKRINHSYYISKVTDKASEFPLSELKGFQRSDAISQGRELCGKLGIELSNDEPEVYVMDAENTNKYVLKHDVLRYPFNTYEEIQAGKVGEEVKWTEDDEVYYMIFRTTLDGTPYMKGGFSTESKYAFDNYVAIALGRNGLKYFKTNNLYEITGSEQLEGSLCSADDALKIMASMYQFTQDKVVLKELELSYVAVGEVGVIPPKLTIRPYWTGTIVSDRTEVVKGETQTYKEEVTVVIDAVNKNTYKGKNPKYY